MATTRALRCPRVRSREVIKEAVIHENQPASGIRATQSLPELFRRHGANPILTVADWPYLAHTVFNARTCQVGDETILLVRVEDGAVIRISP